MTPSGDAKKLQRKMLCGEGRVAKLETEQRGQEYVLPPSERLKKTPKGATVIPLEAYYG